MEKFLSNSENALFVFLILLYIFLSGYFVWYKYFHEALKEATTVAYKKDVNNEIK